MSSEFDPLNTPHSDSDSERTLTASFPDYGDSTSARSPDANLLVGTRRTATLATYDELFSAALKRSPFATILSGTRVTANPANGGELRYDDLQRFFFHTRSLRICQNISFLSTMRLWKNSRKFFMSRLRPRSLRNPRISMPFQPE